MSDVTGERQRQQQPRRFPSIWHLLCIVTVAILIVSDLVSLQNLLVLILSTFYLIFLSIYSFPSPPNSSPEPPIFNNRILPIYVLFAGFIGLLLPIIYIFHAIYYNHNAAAVSAAAPHLFLLSSQVIMEGVASAAKFSIPVRAFVPVFYNSWRLSALVAWVKEETMTSAALESGGSLFGRGLALLNLGLWSYNLFGFLLPVYLPRAFKRYYSPPTPTTSKVD